MGVYLECIQKGYASIVASNPNILTGQCVITAGLFGLGFGLWGAQKITQKVINTAQHLQARGTAEQARNCASFIRGAEVLSNLFHHLKLASFSFALSNAGTVLLLAPAVCFARGVENGCLPPNSAGEPTSKPSSPWAEPRLSLDSRFPPANPLTRTNTSAWAL